MPLAAPIGSGMGIRNRANLRIILEQATVPVIVDAGVGTASDAAAGDGAGRRRRADEHGIAEREGPGARWRGAMRLGVEAGWLGRHAGRIPRRLYANASSPVEGLIE